MSSSAINDAETVALLARWREAVNLCIDKLHTYEIEDIERFQGPDGIETDLRARLGAIAQGKLRVIMSQITPFFDTLQQALLLLATIMPVQSMRTAIVSGGAYLAVKKYAEFDEASKRIVQILDDFKQQLLIFKKYSEKLEGSACKHGLVQMFIAMVEFWVASVRVLSRTSQGSRFLADRWFILDQKVLIAMEKMEESIKFVQQLQTASIGSLSDNVSLAQNKVLENFSADESSRAEFPCHQLDSRNDKFLGRSEELRQIKQAMGRKLPGSPCTVIVSGGAGIGKSSLALEAAHQLRIEGRYDAILWINAENRDVLRESFTKLALRLLLKDALAGADKDLNFMLMKNWMDKTKKTWLLIYDNVQDFNLLNEYLPPETGSMIVTSRFEALSYGMAGTSTRIRLQKFDSTQALELFNNLRLSRDPTCNIMSEHEQVRELLESIDGLALGIKQMAFYIASKHLSITRYQDQYSRMARYILDRKSGPEERHSLGTLWNVHFQDVHGSNASKLLGILSLANPDSFPTELLEYDECGTDGWVSFCTDPEELEIAIDTLTDMALVEASKVDDCLSIHRLTQQAFIYSSFGLAERSNLLEAFEGLLSLLFTRFPTVTSTEGLWKHWADCSRYIPQVSALARTFRTFRNPTKAMPGISPSPRFLKLMISATWYLFEIGEMSECKDLLIIAADACEDKESTEYAWLCNTFVCVAVDENDHDTARSYSQKAISIREAKLEPTAIDLVNSYNNYGNTLNNECRYDEAIDFFAKAYNVLKDVRVDQDNIIYSNLTYLNMARSYALKGDTERATLLLEEVERFFSEKGHKAFLMSVYLTLSCHLLRTGRTLDALRKLEEARTLAREVLPYCMMLAAVHIKLGIVHKGLGLIQEAKKDFESALQLAELHKREGEIARSSWYLAESISCDPTATDTENQEALKLFARAKKIKDRLWESKKDFVMRDSEMTEEQEYDLLVCTWFRANVF